jgi:hypothetical protein
MRGFIPFVVQAAYDRVRIDEIGASGERSHPCAGKLRYRVIANGKHSQLRPVSVLYPSFQVNKRVYQTVMDSESSLRFG